MNRLGRLPRPASLALAAGLLAAACGGGSGGTDTPARTAVVTTLGRTQGTATPSSSGADANSSPAGGSQSGAAGSPKVPNAPSCRILSLAEMTRVLGHPIEAVFYDKQKIAYRCGFAAVSTTGHPEASLIGPYFFVSSVDYICEDGSSVYKGWIGDAGGTDRSTRAPGSRANIRISSEANYIVLLRNGCVVSAIPAYDMHHQNWVMPPESKRALVAVLDDLYDRTP